eukprot:scaffold26342_cov54-Attheya_sp.AAC.4
MMGTRINVVTTCVAWVWLVTLVGSYLYAIHTTQQKVPNTCTMTYSWPVYTRVLLNASSTSSTSSKYGLYSVTMKYPTTRFRNGQPVLFVPGHLGSYQQARSIGRHLYDHSSSNHQPHQQQTQQPQFDLFALDFLEQPSALSGALLHEQGIFLNHAIRTIQDLYHNHHEDEEDDDDATNHEDDNQKSILILAHSMGGIVVQHAMQQPNYIPDSIQAMVALSTPLQRPHFALDTDLSSMYQELRRQVVPRTYNHPTITTTTTTITTITTTTKKHTNGMLLISYAGGFMDWHIASPSTVIPTNHKEQYAVAMSSLTKDIPSVQRSIDHACLVWCHELLSHITRIFVTYTNHKDVNRDVAALDPLLFSFAASFKKDPDPNNSMNDDSSLIDIPQDSWTFPYVSFVKWHGLATIAMAHALAVLMLLSRWRGTLEHRLGWTTIRTTDDPSISNALLVVQHIFCFPCSSSSVLSRGLVRIGAVLIFLFGVVHGSRATTGVDAKWYYLVLLIVSGVAFLIALNSLVWGIQRSVSLLHPCGSRLRLARSLAVLWIMSFTTLGWYLSHSIWNAWFMACWSAWVCLWLASCGSSSSCMDTETTAPSIRSYYVMLPWVLGWNLISWTGTVVFVLCSSIPSSQAWFHSVSRLIPSTLVLILLQKKHRDEVKNPLDSDKLKDPCKIPVSPPHGHNNNSPLGSWQNQVQIHLAEWWSSKYVSYALLYSVWVAQLFLAKYAATCLLEHIYEIERINWWLCTLTVPIILATETCLAPSPKKQR